MTAKPHNQAIHLSMEQRIIGLHLTIVKSSELIPPQPPTCYALARRLGIDSRDVHDLFSQMVARNDAVMVACPAFDYAQSRFSFTHKGMQRAQSALLEYEMMELVR